MKPKTKKKNAQKIQKKLMPNILSRKHYFIASALRKKHIADFKVFFEKKLADYYAGQKKDLSRKDFALLKMLNSAQKNAASNVNLTDKDKLFAIKKTKENRAKGNAFVDKDVYARALIQKIVHDTVFSKHLSNHGFLMDVFVMAREKFFVLEQGISFKQIKNHNGQFMKIYEFHRKEALKTVGKQNEEALGAFIENTVALVKGYNSFAVELMKKNKPR